MRSLELLFSELRAIEQDLPASYVSTVIYVAKHESANGESPTASDVADGLGIPRPTMSRIIGTLGDRRLGNTGSILKAPAAGARKALGLLERLPDETNRRQVRIRLTPKGKGLMKRLVGHLAEA